MNTIEIVVGDWSADGHGRTETVVITTDYTAKEVEKAFNAGVKKTGFNIQEHCQEYEDNAVPNDLYDYFDAQGVEYANIRHDSDDGNQGIGSDDYAKIWLKTCELGDPNFKYKVQSNYENKVNIGGYGLFYG
jgi:hypothetical protein